MGERTEYKRTTRVADGIKRDEKEGEKDNLYLDGEVLSSRFFFPPVFCDLVRTVHAQHCIHKIEIFLIFLRPVCLKGFFFFERQYVKQTLTLRKYLEKFFVH